MPYQSKTPTLQRQWEMMKRIPNRPPGISARELTDWLDQQGYPVSRRTVERDLNDLSGAFGLTCETIDRAQRWHWIPHRQPEFGGIELTDAASLLLVRNLLKILLPASMYCALESKFEQAERTLKDAGRNRHARWARKIRHQSGSFPFQPPRIAPTVLDRVHESLLRECQLRLRYAGPGAKHVKDFTLHPLGLVQQGVTPYLVATAFHYSDPRLYALHRMEKVELTDEPIAPPPGFSLDAFLANGAMEFGTGGAITLKARLAERLATYVAETPLDPAQKLVSREDVWHLTASVRDSWQLHMWILSQGDQIVIEKPAALKKRIREILHRTYAQYE